MHLIDLKQSRAPGSTAPEKAQTEAREKREIIGIRDRPPIANTDFEHAWQFRLAMAVNWGPM